MTKLLLIASVFLLSSLSQAQTFKVVKIQGRKAIVEMSDPSMVTLNQSYNVSDSSMPASTGGKGGLRNNALDFNFSLSNRMSAPTGTDIDLLGSYLWNFRSYEVGPILGISSSSGSGASSSTTTFGGKGYYNFNENKPGAETVLSAVGQLAVVSGSGNSATVFGAGGNYRWFLLSQDHCLSFSAIYQMSQSSGTSTTSLQLLAGIATYF